MFLGTHIGELFYLKLYKKEFVNKLLSWSSRRRHMIKCWLSQIQPAHVFCQRDEEHLPITGYDIVDTGAHKIQQHPLDSYREGDMAENLRLEAMRNELMSDKLPLRILILKADLGFCV